MRKKSKGKRFQKVEGSSVKGNNKKFFSFSSFILNSEENKNKIDPKCNYLWKGQYFFRTSEIWTAKLNLLRKTI